MKKLKPHKLALIFPPISPDDREKLRGSLDTQGQLEAIITLNNEVLDGVNRQDILIDDLGQEPEYLDYMNLPMRMRGESPFQYVWAKNFARRHMTRGQLATVGAESIPYFEEEAKERQVANLKQNRPNPPYDGNGDSEFNQDTGADAADESQDARRNSSAAKAAQAAGASQRSVERARRVQKTDPEKFSAVKAGRITLTQAEKDEAKLEAKRKELVNAYARIEKVSGTAFAERARAGEILKGKKEVIAYAALNDGDMVKCRGLIDKGFSVSRAAKYKMTALSRTHSIGDLCLRTVAQGGKFELEMEFQGSKFDITVKEQKPPKPAPTNP